MENCINITPYYIGIGGKAGAGKDTFGKMLQYQLLTMGTGSFSDFTHEYSKDTHPYTIGKFAKSLKLITALAIGCQPKDFEDQDFKTKKNIYGMTNRKLLINIGKNIRDVHPDIWVNIALNDTLNMGYRGVIFTDMRFNNEYEKMDFTIRVVRKRRMTIWQRIKSFFKMEDISEIALDNTPHDIHVVSNEDSLEQLYKQSFVAYTTILGSNSYRRKYKQFDLLLNNL
jgi:hypothetical protein